MMIVSGTSTRTLVTLMMIVSGYDFEKMLMLHANCYYTLSIINTVNESDEDVLQQKTPLPHK